VPAQRTGITFSRLEEYEPDAEPFPGEEPEERDWFCLAPATAPQVRVLLPPVAARRRASRDVERRLIELMTGILEVIDGRRRPSLFRTALADEPYEVMCTTARHAAVAGLRHRLATLHTC